MLCYIYPSTTISQLNLEIDKKYWKITTPIEFVINLLLNFSRDRKERAAREM